MVETGGKFLEDYKIVLSSDKVLCYGGDKWARGLETTSCG